MYARIVTINLKPESTAKFTKAIEEGVIPLLRKHKGFLDQISMVTPDAKIGYGISFWDSKEHAEAYERTGFAEVMKSLDAVLAAPGQVQVCKVTNSTAHHLAAARAA